MEGYSLAPQPCSTSQSLLQNDHGTFSMSQMPPWKEPHVPNMADVQDSPPTKRRSAPAKRKASSAGGDVRSFFAPKAKKPAPKKPSASDVVFDVDAEPWTCSKCTYAHAEAEAGFLQCAACGAPKV